MMVAEKQSDMQSLAALLAGFSAEQDIPGKPVLGLANDSRQVNPGDVFFAVAGHATHGLDYANDAIKQGASVIVWEPTPAISIVSNAHESVPYVAIENLKWHLGEIASRFYHQPSAAMHCIGVTGTDGKTSVSHFIAQALHTKECPCGLIGTLGYGVYGDIRESRHTTPDALRTQLELAKLCEYRANAVVMEVSSHALDQGRAHAVQFETAILTNMSRDHLDYHRSIEAYTEAKRRLFHFSTLKNVVTNLDDDLGRLLLNEVDDGVRVIGYSIDPNFNASGLGVDDWLHAAKIVFTDQGLQVTLKSSWGDTVFTCRLIGNFNVANLLAAAGALLVSGLSFSETISRLQQVVSVPGRMEMLGGDQQPLVIIDYAHTPHALRTALQALRPYCKAELISVFGAGGDRDQGKRIEMGQAAEQFSDRVVLTSDNPRHEDPEQILQDIAVGIKDKSNVVKIEDREEAISAAIETADGNDVILVAGKGHEKTQQIGGRCLSFSDREQVMLALKRWQE